MPVAIMKSSRSVNQKNFGPVRILYLQFSPVRLVRFEKYTQPPQGPHTRPHTCSEMHPRGFTVSQKSRLSRPGHLVSRACMVSQDIASA